MTTQIALCFCSEASQMNEKLLQFQAMYPKRNIINVSYFIKNVIHYNNLLKVKIK